MELDSVNERWQQVVAMRQNEIAQEQAAVATGNDDDEAEESHGEEAALAEARKAPNTLQQGSPSYWRAVANKSVRMYLTFATEGKNDSQLQLQVSQWQAATGLQPEIGKKTILVHLDTALLGESSGPHCQPELRGKRWKPVPCLKYFFQVTFFLKRSLLIPCFHSCRFRTVTSWRSLLLALVSAWAPSQWTRFVAPCLQKALPWLWWTRWALALQSFSRRLPSSLCGWCSMRSLCVTGSRSSELVPTASRWCATSTRRSRWVWPCRKLSARSTRATATAMSSATSRA